MTTKDDGVLRSFDTGATRDTAEGKLDYEGFLSPTVLRQYARFMNMNRLQSDGKLRDSDNWQKGIDMDVYMKSGFRHFFEWWEAHRDVVHSNRIDKVAAICGLMFNCMGYLHEWLKDNNEVRFDADEPTKEMAERQKNIPGEVPLSMWVPTLESAFTAILRDAGKLDSIKVVINPDERDEPCVCPPGDCDTGRIDGFAMPTDKQIQEEVDEWADNGFDDGDDDCDKYTRED